jgi:hypothetical protein
MTMVKIFLPGGNPGGIAVKKKETLFSLILRNDYISEAETKKYREKITTPRSEFESESSA